VGWGGGMLAVSGAGNARFHCQKTNYLGLSGGQERGLKIVMALPVANYYSRLQCRVLLF